MPLAYGSPASGDGDFGLVVRVPRRIAGFTGTAVAFSPDGASLVAGGSDGQVRVWSVPGLAAMPSLPVHGPGVVKARFSPAGRRLAVAGGGGTLGPWCG